MMRRSRNVLLQSLLGVLLSQLGRELVVEGGGIALEDRPAGVLDRPGVRRGILARQALAPRPARRRRGEALTVQFQAPEFRALQLKNV